MNNWSGNENDVMRGYVVLAGQMLINDNVGFTEEHLKALLRKLYRSTDEMTADQAYRYYQNSEF